MKKYLVGFLIGTILSGGIVLAATKIDADKVDYSEGVTVKDKIDDLYTKVKPNYTGSTTITPSTSTQTLSTNDKVLNSDITINPIPSSYKNLTTTTSVNANNLLSGVKAYTSDGTLITGTASITDCISGTYVKPANSQINLSIGFMPSRLVLGYFVLSDNGYGYVLYDESEDATFYFAKPYSKEVTVSGSGYSFTNKKLISNYATSSQTYKNEVTYYYIACK